MITNFDQIIEERDALRAEVEMLKQELAAITDAPVKQWIGLQDKEIIDMSDLNFSPLCLAWLIEEKLRERNS
jgi:hypothetical protein